MKEFSLKKLYYSISEVSDITNLEQHVLRFWETQFSQLTPAKNRSGNRIYTEKDIRIVLAIKTLLRTKQFTIDAARTHLKSCSIDQILNELDVGDVKQVRKQELLDIRKQLHDLLVDVRKNFPSFSLTSGSDGKPFSD